MSDHLDAPDPSRISRAHRGTKRETAYLESQQPLSNPPWPTQHTGPRTSGKSGSEGLQDPYEQSARSRSSKLGTVNHSPQNPVVPSRDHSPTAPREHRHRRHRRRHSRSAARYSTSRSPLRGRLRNSSVPRGPRSPKASSRSTKSPFHAGLQDILEGLFGYGAGGPTGDELRKLADDFGDLIVGELVDRLVEELKDGLLEKLLIEYLEELVTGAVRKKMTRNSKGKSKDKDDEGDWKKGLLKRAALVLAKRFTH
ncbi:hypothetical protein JX266_002468 [Neoarthrinium moseri]|nr:hypothetical protein JX266_002468 [Neoarthrinium moseri]